MHKYAAASDFVCSIRNVTPQPVQLTVPFGQMEGQPRMTGRELENLLTQNRRRVAEVKPETAGAMLREAAAASRSTPAGKIEIEAPELL